MKNRAPIERLDKILSKSGYGSRTDAKKLIRAGAVKCNGEIVTAPEAKYPPESTRITVDDAEIKYTKHIYLMMNKPTGVISSTDEPGQLTVIDLLPERYKTRNLFPAGRLDKDTTGLLLLTDDGDFAHRLLSPKKRVEKEYEATLDKKPSPEVIEAFERGILLGGQIQLHPAILLPLHTQTDETQPPAPSPTNQFKAHIIITEGKYHQIKRMFASYDINIIKLNRHRIGALSLDPTLKPGETRELTTDELSLLR